MEPAAAAAAAGGGGAIAQWWQALTRADWDRKTVVSR